jgi:hypothetical protein
MPVLGDEQFYNSGYRASLSLEYPLTPVLAPVARAATSSFALKGLDAISVLEGSVGVSGSFNFLERLFSRTELTAGLYRASWGTYTNNGVVGSAQTELGFRLSPALRISAETGFSRYLQAGGDLYSGFSFGINFTIEPARFDPVSTNVRIETLDITPVFPVFYSYYNDHSFGSAKLWNGEGSNIRNVKVSFYVPEYMTGPKECASFDSIGQGDTVTIPIRALFNERLLSLTEQTKSQGELLVEYSILGSKRSYRQEIDVTIHHRNAMTWSDDRRAAAFVSGKDPAVLWFSRFVNSVVRDRFRTGIDRNLQQAVGIFEAMDIFGISYVVDPTSAYADSVGKEGVVDYLQYPHQTLFYRGGDCDDLSILFTSLLQSVGIQTAFITIPGHIYMAFATDMTEASAKKDFYDPNLLIFKDGKVWIPVEITMVKDGFVKAWRVGAKEYSDNALTGKANFYPMEDSWRLYPPANVSNVNPRFLLPDEAVTMKTFDMELDRYVARQIEPLLRKLQLTENAAPNKETENQIGSIYARYGMLDQAWTYLSKAAQKGYLPSWVNLANIAFIRKDFVLAKQYYQYVRDHDPFEPTAPLGIARCEYELENYDAATKAYDSVRSLDPSLTKRYSYLVSIFGGEGRAWTLSDRANSVEWLDTIRTAPSNEPKMAEAKPSVANAEKIAVVPKKDEVSPPLAEKKTAAVPIPVEKPPAASIDRPVEPTPPIKIAEANPSPVDNVPFDTPAKQENPSNSATAPATAPASSLVEVPRIALTAPKDADIAQKEADRAALPAQESATAPAVPVVESPRIALTAPKDADIAQKEADRVVSPALESVASPVVDAAIVAAAAPAKKIEKPNIQAPKVAEARSDNVPPPPGPLSLPEAAAAPAVPAVESAVPAPLVAMVRPENVSPTKNDSAQNSQFILDEPQPFAEFTQSVPSPTPKIGGAAIFGFPPEPDLILTEPKPVVMPEATIKEKAVDLAPSIATAPKPSPEVPTTPNSVPILAAPLVPVPETSTSSEGALVAAIPAIQEPSTLELLRGFGNFKKGPGTWSIQEDRAFQTDPKQRYAKIAAILPEGADTLRFSFEARTTGNGWTGFGVHVLAEKVRTLRGYGAGHSILVWFTSDSRSYPTAPNRIQVYLSNDDINMRMVADNPLLLDFRQKHSFTVEIDRLSGKISARIDGIEYLNSSNEEFRLDGSMVIFRSLDSVEFYNFRAESVLKEIEGKSNE